MGFKLAFGKKTSVTTVGKKPKHVRIRNSVEINFNDKTETINQISRQWGVDKGS